MLVAKSFIPKKLREKILSYVNVDVPIKLNKDLSIKVPIIGGVGRTLLRFSQDWFVFLLERLLDIKQGAFFDVGTNIGQSLISLYAARQDRKYVGFEPNLLCVNYINKLIQANELFRNNCIVIPIALSDKATIIKLYTPQADKVSSSATVIQDLRPKWDLFESYIPAFPLEDVCKFLGLGQVSMIKIDVEGAELDVIKGAYQVIFRDKPLILCEVLFRDEIASPASQVERNVSVMKLLNELDYVALQLIKTPDLKSISNLIRVTEFSNEVWTHQNKDLCDYLFVPKENEELVRSKLSL